MRLSELAERLGCELRGDGAVEIVRVAPIESAGAGELTFIANPRYLRHLPGCRAAAIILAADAPDTPLPSLRTAEPYLAFSRAVELFHVPLAWAPGRHATAQVAASARVAPDAAIGAFAVIGERVRIGAGARIAAHVVVYDDVTIGERFTAHAHVTVRERVRIGDDVVLHAGAVIGSDGFGYAPTEGGIRRLLQGGEVLIEDEVEVGANSTIDRAMVGSTVLRRGVKADNLVMIAHGCEVGAHSMLAAQVGLSGSTRLGTWVRMGGQAGAAGHLSIGDGAQVAAKAGVSNSVAAGATVGGYPAVEIGVWRRTVAALNRLPGLVRRVRRLERLAGVEVPDQP
jgi:UDP-3-O-[3-hydroxymyristoyl] glucosamine N-acyltransferase